MSLLLRTIKSFPSGKTSEELVELVRQIFLSKSSSVWAEQFDEADVPFAIVETVDAAMENEQVIIHLIRMVLSVLLRLFVLRMVVI